MYSFSSESRNKLSQIDPKLQRLLCEAIKIVDFSITEGHRTKQRQEELFNQGKTKTLNSKHLPYPSQAVDIAMSPYGTDEKSIRQLFHITGIIRGLSHLMDIKIRIGHDWDNDGESRDETFVDAWHVEII